MDNEGTQVRVADYNGEGTMVKRDAGDSWVAMMAVMVEDHSGRQWWRRRTIMVADNDGGRWWGLQDQAADYDGEGWERTARDGGDSRVAMMAAAKMAAAEDSGGGRQQQWWRTPGLDGSSGRQRHARLGSRLKQGKLGAGGEQRQH
jgi:hypothetical protein